MMFVNLFLRKEGAGGLLGRVTVLNCGFDLRCRVFLRELRLGDIAIRHAAAWGGLGHRLGQSGIGIIVMRRNLRLLVESRLLGICTVARALFRFGGFVDRLDDAEVMFGVL